MMGWYVRTYLQCGERDKKMARQGGSIDTSSRHRKLPDGSCLLIPPLHPLRHPHLKIIVLVWAFTSVRSRVMGQVYVIYYYRNKPPLIRPRQEDLDLCLSVSLPLILSLAAAAGRHYRRVSLHRNPETWLNHGTAKLALNIPDQPRVPGGSTGIGCLSGASKPFSTLLWTGHRRTCQRTKQKKTPCCPCSPLPSPPLHSLPESAQRKPMQVGRSLLLKNRTCYASLALYSTPSGTLGSASIYPLREKTW
ncbi:hypothetical protein F4809DRAFT_385729 [Biscogniauxia mediterranea]|nr:hypothetical protein F4809DRAFT_385729 [Biscogniauxia mediterranea]